MTPESQRIAIAEACGYLNVRMDKHGFLIGDGKPDHQGIPDYLNSLDAMHEAEKVLTLEQRNNYADELFAMLSTYPESYAPVWCMTASQRAEAFLRTLGLWKE